MSRIIQVLPARRMIVNVAAVPDKQLSRCTCGRYARNVSFDGRMDELRFNCRPCGRVFGFTGAYIATRWHRAA